MSKSNKSQRLWEERIFKLLIKLSLPWIVWMLANSLYNIVDSIYIWHFSTKGLAALSLAFPIQLFLISVAGWLGIATSSLISRLLWEGNNDKVKKTTEFITSVTLIYWLIVGFFWIFFAKDILWFLGSDPELISIGWKYLKVIMTGSLFMIIPMVFNNFLRGHWDTFNPMIVMLIWAIWNILIDPFLIFGRFFFPKLWVEWAAFATVIARFFSTVYILFILFKNKYKITFKLFCRDKRILKELLIVWIPATVMMLVGSVMLLWANKIISWYSVIWLAVLGIYGRLQTFILMPLMGLNQWFQPILGYNFGKNYLNRVKKTIFLWLSLALSISFFGFFAFQFFPDILIKLFTNDPELIKMWTIAFKRISLAFPFIWLSMLISTSFQALWKWLPSFVISFLRQIIFLLPLIYFLGKFYGLNSIWYAFPIAEWIAFVISCSRLDIFLLKSGIFQKV